MIVVCEQQDATDIGHASRIINRHRTKFPQLLILVRAAICRGSSIQTVQSDFGYKPGPLAMHLSFCGVSCQIRDREFTVRHREMKTGISDRLRSGFLKADLSLIV